MMKKQNLTLSQLVNRLGLHEGLWGYAKKITILMTALRNNGFEIPDGRKEATIEDLAALLLFIPLTGNRPENVRDAMKFKKLGYIDQMLDEILKALKDFRYCKRIIIYQIDGFYDPAFMLVQDKDDKVKEIGGPSLYQAPAWVFSGYFYGYMRVLFETGVDHLLNQDPENMEGTIEGTLDKLLND